MLEVLDFCCGGGGFSLGFQKAGFHVKYAIDHDVRVKETFEKNHPKTEFILGDVREIDPQQFKDINILIGSPPCQNFSIASSNRNVENGLELVRVFFQWVKTIKPDYWIMENVKPLKKILKTRRNEIEIPLITILNSANFGVPQRRKRCFSGKFFIPKPTHAKHPFIDLMGKRKRKWKSISEVIGDLLEKNKDRDDLTPLDYEVRDSFYSIHGKWDLNEPCLTLTTKKDCGLIVRERKENDKVFRTEEGRKRFLRRLTPREFARLQSFPDDFDLIGSESSKYRMIGNSVSPILAKSLAMAIKKRGY